MNASVKFRDTDGPLFRLKAPVRAVLFPFSVGGTFTLKNGTSLRIGSTLPWGATWRLEFWPWGPQPASVAFKYPLKWFGGSLHLGAEVELQSGAARLMLRAKPRLGAFSVVQTNAHSQDPPSTSDGVVATKESSSAQPAGQRLRPGMCVLHVHSAIPLGTCQWAQMRWEVATPTDAILQERWLAPSSRAAAGAASGRGVYGTSGWPPLTAKPWLRVKLGKISLLRMTDRQSARQGLCAACMRAPIVREQTPAVKNGMALQDLAAAYARTKLEEVAPQLKSLRRDRLADLKAVTLATWMVESGAGTSRLATHHCNYSRIPWRGDLAGLATAVSYKGKDTKGDRGLYSSFDSANDFIVGYWRTIERNRLKHGWESQLETASGSDSACRTFLETLYHSGIVRQPEKVAELIPEARRLLAQGRG